MLGMDVRKILGTFAMITGVDVGSVVGVFVVRMGVDVSEVVGIFAGIEYGKVVGIFVGMGVGEVVLIDDRFVFSLWGQSFMISVVSVDVSFSTQLCMTTIVGIFEAIMDLGA